MKPLRLFIGYDPRQPIAYTVAAHSAFMNCSMPLAITPLVLKTLPMERRGLTEFTFSRYLVPYLCGYEGHALFIDSDMLVRGDLAELPWDHESTVAWVDHGAAALHPERSLAFERSSVMLFNCNKCCELTPEFIDRGKPESLGWVQSLRKLDPAWNHLVGYDRPRTDAKIVHFTQGIPCFEETAHDEYARDWALYAQDAQSTVPWDTISGQSVHAQYKRQNREVENLLHMQIGDLKS